MCYAAPLNLNVMTKEATYDLVGHLAVAFRERGITVTFATLNAILRDQKASYTSTRGLATGLSAAYDHWKRKGEQGVSDAIAHTFTDRNGDLAWRKKPQ